MAELHELTSPAHPGARVVHDSTDPATPDGKLEVRPNEPFIYHFAPRDPGNWSPQVIEGGSDVPEDDVGVWWLPMLKMLPERPGVLGVHTPKKGDPSGRHIRDAKSRLEERGHTIIPRSENYCVAQECRDPRTKREGMYYMDAWSTPKVRLQGKAQKFEFDRQRYRRWLLSLIRRGVIQPPHPDVVDARAARIAVQVDRRMTVAMTTLAGDPDRAETYLAEVSDRADNAKLAQVPESRVIVAERDATDPAQMSYRELQKAAKDLGFKTGGLKTEALRAIVEAGETYEEEE